MLNYVAICTKERSTSLDLLLQSLADSKFLIEKIIIVDSSVKYCRPKNNFLQSEIVYLHEPQLNLIEANEAFAAQAEYVNQKMKWDISKVNINGGAIAIGHPIGASGARILVTLLHEMRRSAAKKALATLCIGGGMGIAMCLELA